MRYLILLHGLPGSGKSSFIVEHSLQPYTISPDDLRLQIESPVLGLNGGLEISQQNDRLVWERLFELTENRMKRGELIVIDATHTTTRSLEAYKKLKEKYRYRVYVVNFDTDLGTCKIRNQNRVEYKIVPEAVLENMARNLQTQKIPGFIEVIRPEDFDSVVQYNIPNFDKYTKIHHIGDLQGTFTPLKEYFDRFGIQENELYIFIGDYVDRGKENHLVVEFLMELSTRENVIFLEGNHEEYLWQWATDQDIKTNEFKLRTMPQLENYGISKKKVRVWLSKLRQLTCYTFQEKTVLVTHGGLSNLPQNLLYISTKQLIRGTGLYNEVGLSDDSFLTHTKENTYQIHGHRNSQEFPTQYNPRCFNLEGKVEFGGNLRVVTLDKNGFEVVEIPSLESKLVLNSKEFEENETLLANLRNNQYIQEKRYDQNISSFNFSRQAFYDKVWNEQTMRARGLFLNNQTTEILIRSYNKFFNLGETADTKYERLLNTLVFPINIWVKENGYLGLVGYNSQFDSLVFASKSSTNSEFAGWLEKRFYEQIQPNQILEIKNYLKTENVSLIFEVVEPVLDPHIIAYDEPKLVLLDIIYRIVDFKVLEYNQACDFAKKYNLGIKQKATEIKTLVEFEAWYKEISAENYKFENNFLEGFVVEDDSGFNFKIKLHYYAFWKQMRSLLVMVSSRKEVVDFGRYLEPETAKEFYNFLKTQPQKNLENLSLIQLRKAFEELTKR